MACKLSVLAIPDLHAPFIRRGAINFIADMLQKVGPDVVVLLGDVTDQHAMSRFTRDPSGLSSGDEFRQAKRQLNRLYKYIPEAKVCIGNHDRRVYDRAAEVGIPAAAIRPWNGIIEAPDGWDWADGHELDGVIYEHGDNWSGRDAHIKAATGNMQNTVIGHIHSHAAVSYIANRRYLIWGFNAGCLIDSRAYAFSYARKTPAKPILGVGAIVKGVPSFLPMPI